MTFSVNVDDSKCHGHARCWTICPDVFDIDDTTQQAFVVAAKFEEALLGTVEEAIAACPERAISLTR